MKDDELETWRRQWQGQPAVPIDLIRKVERETVRMRLGQYILILPLAINIAATIGAILNPTMLSVLFAAGLWLFVIIANISGRRDMKGVWAPTAETTAAYVDLSIRRCRSRLSQIRFSNVLTPLLTIFVLAGLYEMFASSGKLEKTEDYVIVGLSFLWTIGVVSFALIFFARQRKKIAVELAYLSDLKHRMEND